MTVHGRVQGVGFRWFVRVRARALGLSGWVRNDRDGSVEVLAVGAPDALEELRAALGKGPPGAQVSAVQAASRAPQPEPSQPFAVLK